jgi:tetratricopeptide (TPR) repeat protein
MRIFAPPLDISDMEGFTAEKDIFGRAHLGRGLTNLVSNIADPMVIALDGQWGSGKTTFLKMWAGDLRKNRFPVVYFDAFANDYIDDAFTAIAGQLIALAQDKQKAATPAAKRFLKGAVTTGKVILRSSLKLAVKGATYGALDTTDFSSAASDVAGEMADVVDKHLGQLLTKQRDQSQAIDGFRKALGELPSLLTEPTQDGDKAERPLVFIIDELDRCRPIFALEILERIKHFFAVPKIHFVLGTSLRQLRNSITVAYGPTIDAQGYLQKFIHLTLFLVDQGRHHHERVVTKYVDYLAKALELKNDHFDLVGEAAALIRHVGEHRDLSLRAIEQSMSTLALALAYKPDNALSPAPILGGLCLLKVTSPDLFAKAKAGTLDFREVRSPLAFPDPPSGEDQGNIEHAIKLWQYYADRTLAKDHHLVKEFSDYRPRDRLTVVPLVANTIVDRLLPS